MVSVYEMIRTLVSNNIYRSPKLYKFISPRPLNKFNIISTFLYLFDIIMTIKIIYKLYILCLYQMLWLTLVQYVAQ